MKLENVGWGISFDMVCKNYYRKVKKYNTSKKYVSNKPEPTLIIKQLDSPEHQHFLMHQTLEQFQLAKVHGWRIAKMLTEPEPNFHYEETNPFPCPSPSTI